MSESADYKALLAARERADEQMRKWIASIKAEALRGAASNKTLRNIGHSGISVRKLRALAARFDEDSR